MLEQNTLIKVKNRDNGTVGYTIPDLGNLHRNFQPGESKDITMDELRKLSWTPGGKTLLKNYFILDNKDAVQELLGEVEPEYNYTEKEVEILLTTASMEQFMDALEFAPTGVIELIKSMSVSLKLNDVAKRQAILEKTGFNVTNAISINEEAQSETEQKEERNSRRSVPLNTVSKLDTGSRKTEPITTATITSKYNIKK